MPSQDDQPPGGSPSIRSYPWYAQVLGGLLFLVGAGIISLRIFTDVL